MRALVLCSFGLPMADQLIEGWTINSSTSYKAFVADVARLFDEHKYITYSAPRIGPDRSLDQNALLHVWCTEYAAHLLTKHKKAVSAGELEGMKRIAKKRFYNHSGHPWLIHDMVNPFTRESRKEYTSSKSWKSGEMFVFLTWLQNVAAEGGLVLESKGKFSKLQREHNGD